jgi:hypothetical protein
MEEEKRDSTAKTAEKPETENLGSQENSPSIAKNSLPEKDSCSQAEKFSSKTEETSFPQATDPSLVSSEDKGFI